MDGRDDRSSRVTTRGVVAFAQFFETGDDSLRLERVQTARGLVRADDRLGVAHELARERQTFPFTAGDTSSGFLVADARVGALRESNFSKDLLRLGVHVGDVAHLRGVHERLADGELGVEDILLADVRDALSVRVAAVDGDAVKSQSAG